MPMASASGPAQPGHGKGGGALTGCPHGVRHLVHLEGTDTHRQQEKHMSGGVLLGGMRVVRNLLCGGVIRVDVVAWQLHDISCHSVTW